MLLKHASAAILLAAATHAGAAEPVPAAPEAVPITIGTSHRLPSRIMDDVREINVWLPAGYAGSSERYPVLYLIDGALNQDFPHIAALGQLGEVSGTFGPVIIVGVQTKTRAAELTPPATDPRYRRAFSAAGGAATFRRFLAEEVVPFVTARYRTGARKGLAGESLAGLFVVDTFLKSPQSFDDYIAVSPSLWWDDRSDMRRAGALLQPGALAGRRLYLAVANEGGTMQDGVDMLRRALDASAPAGFTWRYADRSGSETHSTIFHGAALDALRWLYQAPPYDYGPTPWYMIEGGSPPA